jgi:hypothetical protein
MYANSFIQDCPLPLNAPFGWICAYGVAGMRWRAWGIGLVGSKIRSILGINKIIRKNVSAERQGVMFGLNLTRRGGVKSWCIS